MSAQIGEAPWKSGGRRCGAALLAAACLAAGAAPANDAAGPGSDDLLEEVLALDGDAARGASAWQTCAACHGADGAGRPDGTFPRLAGQHRTVVAKQVVDIRVRRRANPVMQPHAERLLDAQEMADLATFVATLPPPGPAELGPGDDLERGALLYARDCADCHGSDGSGDARHLIPVLSGQHYAYLLRQVRAIAARRRGNGHAEMERRVAEYSDADLRAVVDYAGRLAARPPAP